MQMKILARMPCRTATPTVQPARPTASDRDPRTAPRTRSGARQQRAGRRRRPQAQADARRQPSSRHHWPGSQPQQWRRLMTAESSAQLTRWSHPSLVQRCWPCRVSEPQLCPTLTPCSNCILRHSLLPPAPWEAPTALLRQSRRAVRVGMGFRGAGCSLPPGSPRACCRATFLTAVSHPS